jgi:hypothetical protein
MVEDAEFAGPLDMPVLQAVHAEPSRLVAFSDAMKPSWKDFDCGVHFFEDDCIINRFWNNPRAYVDKLSKFQCVTGLDYSVSWDFPVALKYYNHYRNSVCTYWLQSLGFVAVPQARCEEDNYSSVLAGFPKHSTIAIGARSMVRNLDDRKVLIQSVQHIVDFLEPTNLLWYGSDAYGVTEYPLSKGIPIRIYPGKGRGNLGHDPSEANR